MTAPAPEIYPQYCFHLSPTANKFCPVLVKDVVALRTVEGFQNQNTYFHLNHPLVWVRIAGVVVGIDDYTGRRIYTVDDSSGATIHCLVTVPKDGAPDSKLFPADVDIGHVIDVKGGLSVFRDQKQITAEKIVILRSTDQEVDFWTKVRQFREDVLGKPWVLEAKIIRRLRREVEKDGHEKKEKTRSKRDETTTKEDRQTRHDRRPLDMQTRPRQQQQDQVPQKRPLRVTGLEKRVKRRHKPPSQVKYDALGI